MSGEAWAIIPARGGSKGIPRKNISLLGGKPLIVHTIESALRAESVSRVFVSTEDEEIASVARAAGAEVPFLRPKALAGDAALVRRAVDDLLDRLDPLLGRPDVRVVLFPTSPFRRPGLIDEAVRGAERHGRMASVRRLRCPADRYLLREGSGAFCPAAPGAFSFEALQMVGVAVATREGWAGKMEDSGCLFIDEVEAVDIDRPEDLLRAETILRSEKASPPPHESDVRSVHPHPVTLSRFVEAGSGVIRVKAMLGEKLWKQRWFRVEGDQAFPLLGRRERGAEITLEREAGRWKARCPEADRTEVWTGEEGEGVTSFFPIEMEGLWSVHPERFLEKTNRLTGELITGRQQYPEMFVAPESVRVNHQGRESSQGKAVG